jgi:CHAT domain-containing protein
MGKAVKALEFFTQALALMRTVNDPPGESLALFNLARVQRDRGDLEQARSNVELALKISESIRTTVSSQQSRASYFASTHQYYETYIDILMILHRQKGDPDFEALAFNASERARARSLLELLKEAGANIRTGVVAAVLEREQQLVKELNAKSERHRQLMAAGNDAEARALSEEIKQLTYRIDEVESQIRATSPKYASLMQPQPLTVEQIQQQVLDDNSLLLQYSLGDDRSYLWAVTRDQVTSYELPGRRSIEELVRKVYGQLTADRYLPGETSDQRFARVAKANEQLVTEIANLSNILIGPVADKLGTKRLLVVPDGALQYIPFQILHTSAASRPLVVDHEIVNEPSASALALLVSEAGNRNPARNSVAVFADPVFESDDPRIKSTTTPKVLVSNASLQETELARTVRDVGLGNVGRISRLPASRDEADAIMAAAPWWSGFKAMGFEASRATVLNTDLSSYRFVHFATHGFLNDEHPELSGVVLSLFDEQGQPQEGFLRLHDIYNMKLPVDLVVLSACNTGLGKDVRGEGLIGLTRGFMYAGASSVVASLWKVDDEATAELMSHFYRFMLTDGLSPAAALRKAQIEMSQQKRWQSPYYWSGFVIQGQYLQRPVNNSRLHWLALVISVTAIFLGALFLVLRRRRRKLL